MASQADPNAIDLDEEEIEEEEIEEEEVGTDPGANNPPSADEEDDYDSDAEIFAASYSSPGVLTVDSFVHNQQILYRIAFEECLCL